MCLINHSIGVNNWRYPTSLAIKKRNLLSYSNIKSILENSLSLIRNKAFHKQSINCSAFLLAPEELELITAGSMQTPTLPIYQHPTDPIVLIGKWAQSIRLSAVTSSPHLVIARTKFYTMRQATPYPT